MGKRERIALKVYVLPNEIEEQILSRLPVKTILRFMSVCKSWYSLFLNPYFTNIHSKNNSNHLLVMRLRTSKAIVVMKSSSSTVESRFCINPYLLDSNFDIELSIVGSCNGIVCVHGFLRHSNAHGTLKEYFYLWNPAMNVTKNILKSVGVGYLNMGENTPLFVGFGFHNNDYKVVRFQNSSLQNLIQVEIYSLSSDSWRTLNAALPPHVLGFYFYESKDPPSRGIYVSGAHHWVVRFLTSEIEFSFSIISFYMGEAVFKEIIIPSEWMESDTILFNYNESLAMLTFCRFTMDHMTYIWVMKDYGLPESWTKLCMIDVHQQLGRLFYYYWESIFIINEVILLSYIYDGEVGTVVFDINNSQMKANNIEALTDAIEVDLYRESFSLLN